MASSYPIIDALYGHQRTSLYCVKYLVEFVNISAQNTLRSVPPKSGPHKAILQNPAVPYPQKEACTKTLSQALRVFRLQLEGF